MRFSVGAGEYEGVLDGIEDDDIDVVLWPNTFDGEGLGFMGESPETSTSGRGLRGMS